MANAINIGEISNAIASELSKYTTAVADEVKKASDDVSKKMFSKIKADAPKKTGDYRKAMRLKAVHESNYEKRNRWYVDPKTGEYRLSHLLENGYDKANGGGSVAPRPHIKQNEQDAIQEFERRVKEAITNVK